MRIAATSLLFSASALFVLIACSDSSDTTNAPTTGTADAAVVDATSHADARSTVNDSAATTSDAPTTCDVSPLPASAPAITSEVTIADADGGGLPPTSSGGDEKGVWLYSKVHIYLEASAQGLVDPAKSTVTGNGWIAFDGARFRTSTDTLVTLVTSVAGTVVRPMTTVAFGTYAHADAGAALTLTQECRVSDSDLNGAPLGFTRLTDTTARLIVTTSNALGNFTIVTDLTRGT